MNRGQRNKIAEATVKLCEFIELDVGLGLHNNSLSILAQIVTTFDDYTTDEQGREKDKAEARIEAQKKKFNDTELVSAKQGQDLMDEYFYGANKK